jgi:hypothetical protein
MAALSLKLLSKVKEQGEIRRELVMNYMQLKLNKRIRKNSTTIYRRGVVRPILKAQIIFRVKPDEAA